ncbi:MAG: glycosyltransferase family 39 protein, partial [Deltaproteobacteria bacterium]|nr:glycosyltransferase family 39 protein [Deltaproteobacteria bacterium]MBW2536046.1 glycosyltransferase family 39 protein [Deltaproteobacteria bacterium]
MPKAAPPPPRTAAALRAVARWWSAGSVGHLSVALLAVALLPRLYVAIAWASTPVWDGHFYDFGAQRIAAGLGYADDLLVGSALTPHPWCHYPVGYSALLAAPYRLLGHGPYVVPTLNAIIGALLAVVIYRTARHATTEPRARVAGLLVAAHPGLITYTPLAMTELTAALAVSAAAWAATVRGCRPWRGALPGLVLGLATLVRPQSILLAPAIALFAGPATPVGAWARRALPLGAIAVAAALAVVSPWTLRNCRVMDGCAFVSTNAGWNLAIGSFPRATGRFSTLRSSDGCQVITGQVQQDRCWWGRGVEWIRADPGRWLGLIPRKLGETFDHESYAVGYLAEANPTTWPEARRERARGWLTAIHQLVLWLAALGVVAWPLGRRR